MDIVNLDHLSSVYDNNRSKGSANPLADKGPLTGGFSFQNIYSLSGMSPPTSPQTFSFPTVSKSTQPVSLNDFMDYFCHSDGNCSFVNWEPSSHLHGEASAPQVVAVAGREHLNGGIFSFGYSSITT